jgi:nitric oxide reductase subunit B
MLVSFTVLGVVGYKAINSAPPIPSKVVTADGRVRSPVRPSNGQNVWQSTGGQEIGTIWGHGAYVAPTGRRLSPPPVGHRSRSLGETAGRS